MTRGLLAADLRMLANLPASAAGRRAMFGLLIGLGLLGTLSLLFAQTTLDHPLLLRQLTRGRRGDELHSLLGYGLMVCPLVASWLGLSLAQRQLFDAPELGLWATSPLPSWRGPLQILLRASFVSTAWSLALCAPFLATVLSRSAAPALTYALLPLAVLGATVPMLGVLLALHIVLVRFLAGRWLRFLLGMLAALASVGFTTWLLLTLFRPPEGHVQALRVAADEARPLPWTVDVAAHLLSSAANHRFEPRALVQVLGWLIGTLLLFRLVARLHPRAYERHLAAAAPLWRGNRRRWPASLTATIRRKELAQVLQQPGALLSFVVYGVLVFALTRQQVLVAGILDNWRLPRELAHLAALCGQWFLAVLLVLFAHMSRLCLWDAAQWSLYVASPGSAAALLRGKLQAIGLLLAWPLVLVAVAGAQQLQANVATLAVFAAIGLAGTLAALGVLATIGTLPLWMRPGDGEVVLQGGRTFIAAIALVLSFQLVVAPAALGWSLLQEQLALQPLRADELWPHAPTLIAAALGYGALVVLIGGWIGTRNLRALLAPR